MITEKYFEYPGNIPELFLSGKYSLHAAKFMGEICLIRIFNGVFNVPLKAMNSRSFNKTCCGDPTSFYVIKQQPAMVVLI